MANQHSPDRAERPADASSKPDGAGAAVKLEGATKPETPAKPETPLGVERLTHLDVNEVCGLYKKVWEAQRGELPPEMIKAWVPAPLEFTSWMEGVNYFAARRNGRLVGVIGLEISQGSGRIVHLAVDPDARRQGVATALIKAAIEWARRSNCPSVWADALSRFTAAADLLTHLGFHDAGVLRRHQWNEDVRFFEQLL